ncbi:filamin-A-like [Xylocopa sonorina]|uniref:filamin-A-like n=1 Tax=Xylocopa sonorina TaxID=1818115 RepID=UPI00403A8655
MSSRRNVPADKMCGNETSAKREDGTKEEEMLEQDLLESAPWKRIQQNSFTRWANERLKIMHVQIDDLKYDLSDGLRLITLIEVLAQKKLPKPHQNPVYKSQKLENVSLALEFLQNEGIKTVNIGK